LRRSRPKPALDEDSDFVVYEALPPPSSAVRPDQRIKVLIERHEAGKSLWNPADAVYAYQREAIAQRTSSGAHEKRHADERDDEHEEDCGRVSHRGDADDDDEGREDTGSDDC
jgi:hypothetical protein